MEGIKHLSLFCSARNPSSSPSHAKIDDQNLAFDSRALLGQFKKIYLFLEIQSICGIIGERS